MGLAYKSFCRVWTLAVPSEPPRNVSVHLNESVMFIRWVPPPLDKINGILKGYDVIIKHGVNGTHMNKVSVRYESVLYVCRYVCMYGVKWY